MEERQLHERHQLAKRQLKDLFFLQRHQMLVSQPLWNILVKHLEGEITKLKLCRKEFGQGVLAGARASARASAQAMAKERAKTRAKTGVQGRGQS